jgi:hypothetical protein
MTYKTMMKHVTRIMESYKRCFKKYPLGRAWCDKFANTMKRRKGWVVKHPGAEKYVATNDSLDFVVKWEGRCGYSQYPILEELKIYEKLRELGLKRHIPKVYAHEDNNIIIEQKVIRFNHSDEHNEIYNKQWPRIRGILNRYNLCIWDDHMGNVGIVKKSLKIIDGRLGKT